ncbi:MAG TPA: SusC/RagA family TonB-linked outer membrane protein [Dinghuibacter sp.]|jgi:TonB-linked SusC/RagA family outer membrane protein|uniref:SusC/RagA family TonB-linked outer membrane protein n=1 Tax=Dinghuibacter sp. TaxID=2024697 RepID=UPI002BB2FB2D|nr:SusC/RagA family TonB-linked outer membrane protein [Dinghuibacter sp.]HTJ12573.1 SusC/RagA family TonB-linked outer membrane protein [Dinghuibacter sp.]
MLLQALEREFLPRRRTRITKTLLAMRLTTILLLATSLHLSARTGAQQINLTEQHASLDKVFKKISDQTGYLFVYRDEWLKQTRDVTISVHNASLKDVLDICFNNQPFTYTIIDKMVVLKEKPAPAVLIDRQPDGSAIHGRVVDNNGAPLAGASIRVKGTTSGAQSDVRGDFELKNLTDGMVLIVSYTGYVTKEDTVSAKNRMFIYVVLQRSQDELDAMVIQAYGTTSRRFNVGSIATVDASTIEKQPVTNVLLALAGQVPGLAVNATTGVPGSQVLIQVRGQNTVNSNPYTFRPYDQPLFIIDGVPFAPQNNNISQLNNLSNAQSYSGGINAEGGISPFDNINPNDIESVTILKDADATSIYGTQGSNGVILITTKKGKPGKTVFNLVAETGDNIAARSIKLMNTQQYLQYRKDAFAADGITPSNNPYNYGSFAPDLTIFDQNRYTDWEKVIFGKTTNNTDLHASLSGGAYNNTFMVSAGYTRSTYNIPGDFADQRLTLHSNFHHVSNDNRLTLDFGSDFGYDQNNSPGSGAGSSILLPPNTPDLKDAQGNLLWSYQGVDLSQYQFYQYSKKPDLTHNYNLNTTMRIAYKLMTGLTLSANMGYNRNTTSEHAIDPAAAQDPLYAYVTSTWATNNFETINIEPQLDYTTAIGKGMLTSLVGATYKKNTGYSNTVEGYGYANDNFLGSLNGAANVYANDNSTIYKYDAVFARLKYVYDQEYILSLTGRRDGSSNFGPGNQFGNFGSVGAGWIVSEEKAFKRAMPFMDYAKLSGSYGTSGSDGIAAYMYQPFWQPLTYVPAFQGFHPNAPQNLYNPNYSWALKKSLNLAADMGMFHDRLLLNVTWYRDREGNQLGGYPLPAQTGFTQVLENLPANVQNAGWEFSVTSNQIKRKNFSWSTTFNITFNRNKLLSFPNLAGSSYDYSYVLGKPTSEVLGFQYKGLNPQTGLFEYYTSKGQTTNTPNGSLASQGGDLVPIADREVKYMGGFGNTLTYKRLSMYVFFQFSSQEAPNFMSEVYSVNLPATQSMNEPVQVLNYWKNPGDHAEFQKLTTTYSTPAFQAASNFGQSSGAYSSDVYARLKTLALSWSFPDGFLKKARIQNAKIFVNAQNLLTITNYKVGDPETFSNYTALPIQRTIVCGLNFNF